MSFVVTLILTVQMISAVAMVGLILVQHGKGADMGAAFGSGASGSLFGATGSSNFLSKITGLAATIFFIATLGLAFLGNRPAAGTGGVMDKLPANSIPTPSVPVPGAPAAPAASAPAVNSPVPGSPAPAAPGQSGQIPK